MFQLHFNFALQTLLKFSVDLDPCVTDQLLRQCVLHFATLGYIVTKSLREVAEKPALWANDGVNCLRALRLYVVKT